VKRRARDRAKAADARAWEELKVAIREAHAAGSSLSAIGDEVGLTKARVYQIVSAGRARRSA
jgi:hypothetical protein